MSFVDLTDLEQKEILPGLKVRFVHSEHMTVAYWEIDKGAELPLHSHPNEQIANVIEGQLELTVDGEVRTLSPGQVVVIPGGVEHAGKGVTDCRVIDIFYPVREDYKS